MFLRPMSDLGFFSGFQEAQGIMHALNSFEPSHVLQNVACEGVAAYETLWVRHMALRLGELDTYCMAVRVIKCMKLSHVLLRCHTCWQNLTPLGWIPGRYTYTYAAARGIYRDRGAIYRSCKVVDAAIGRRICLIYLKPRQAAVRALMHICVSDTKCSWSWSVFTGSVLAAAWISVFDGPWHFRSFHSSIGRY